MSRKESVVRVVKMKYRYYVSALKYLELSSRVDEIKDVFVVDLQV